MFNVVEYFKNIMYTYQAGRVLMDNLDQGKEDFLIDVDGQEYLITKTPTLESIKKKPNGKK